MLHTQAYMYVVLLQNSLAITLTQNCIVQLSIHDLMLLDHLSDFHRRYRPRCDLRLLLFFYAQALIVESKGGVKTFIPSYVQINNEEEDEVCISVGQGSSARVRFRFLTPIRAHFQFCHNVQKQSSL